MSAAEGLVSYGWWAEYRPSMREAMRRWVREELLKGHHEDEKAADRLIASLPAPKVDDLARRAWLGLPATGF